MQRQVVERWSRGWFRADTQHPLSHRHESFFSLLFVILSTEVITVRLSF